MILVLPNMTMEQSNVRKIIINKGTTRYDKSIIIYNVDTIKCKYETIKCDVLVTCSNRLTTYGYRTPQKKGVL